MESKMSTKRDPAEEELLWATQMDVLPRPSHTTSTSTPPFLLRRHKIPVLILLACITLAVGTYSLGGQKTVQSTYSETTHCYQNALENEGYFDQSHTYRPYNRNCSELPNWIRYGQDPQKIQEYYDAGYWNNKTMLVMGDSIGRGVLEGVCKYFGATPSVSADPNSSNDDNRHRYSKTATRECTVDKINLRLVNMFLYGAVKYTESSKEIISDEWPPAPYNIEDRIQFATEHLLADVDPDLILINGGAWDFKYYYRHDVLKQIVPSSGFSEASLQELTERYAMLLRMTKEIWPRATVVLQQFHHLEQQQIEDRVKEFWSKDLLPAGGKLPDLFTTFRTGQFRSILRNAAEQANVDLLDVTRIFEQFEPSQVVGDGLHFNGWGVLMVGNAALEHLRLANAHQS